MADTLALEYLYNTVVARFASEGSTVFGVAVDQPFGWRPEKQMLAGPRIVWMPGDTSSSAGKLTAARNPGRIPARPLATLLELFTCTISAEDPAAPENELSQYRGARFLFDAWLRAVYLAARGTYTIESIGWVDTQKERRFGAALRVVGTVQAMIPDAQLESAPVDTTAVITVHELNVSETQTDAAAPDPAPPSGDPQ